MAFPPHYLLQWGGDFVSDPSEIWSNTLRFATGGGEDSSGFTQMTTAQQGTAAQALLGVVSDTHANGGMVSSNVRLKYAKFNRINDLGGYYSAGVTSAAYVTGAGTPGGGTSTHPVTAALVVTWLTAIQRGRGSKGRIYVPQPALALTGPTYRFASGVLLGQAGVYRGMINAANSAVVSAGGTGLKACVVSGLGENGHSNKITAVQIGDILDYMGSRRNNLTEARQTSAPVT